MSTVLIIPEKDEGTAPLFVAEQGLRANKVKAVFIVDGWSSDDTHKRLSEALPEFKSRFPGKRVELFQSELRETGKGGAMITGMRHALAAGFKRIAFLDGDISSCTPRWCQLLIEGLTEHGAAMARGTFDRSPLDAQITRHITRPLMAVYFPEGRAIQQPLGGELALTEELARFLLDGQPIAPPHSWGIDTFLTVNTALGGFPIVEVYLTQKTHDKKSLTALRIMLIECFDEMCKQIAYHKRQQAIPEPEEELVTVLSKDDGPERVGEDVRTLQYTDPMEQMKRSFTFFRGMREPATRLKELGVPKAERDLVCALFNETHFRTRSAELDARTWVPLVDQLARGYIEQGFSAVYHDAIFACWQLRALAFALHETESFEKAEEHTERQAEYAYEYGARYRS